MTDSLGLWLSPAGVILDVHKTPPYTHSVHAALICGESKGDPIKALLKKGWVRISIDTIHVWKWNIKTKELTKNALKGKETELPDTLYIEEESTGKLTRTTLSDFFESLNQYSCLHRDNSCALS